MTGRRLCLTLALILMIATSASAQGSVPVIVKLAPGTNVSRVTAILGGTLIDTIPEANTILVRLPAVPVLNLVLRLAGVEWLEADAGIRLPSVISPLQLQPGSFLPSDWYGLQPSFELIHTSAASRYSTGRGILVADINSKVDIGHPTLAGHVGAGADFVEGRSADQTNLNQSTAGFLDDGSGFLDQSTAGFLDGNGIAVLHQSTAGFLDGGAPAHGTFCVGIIVAVAPDATIMPLRAFDDDGNSDVFTLAKAIRYAKRNGAQVINMSFGTLTDSKALREAIDSARASGIVLIASAGNNNTSSPQYPAAYPGVLAVAATDLADRKTDFSNFGSYIFVDAPGANIVSTSPNGGYSISSGTSFSAPMVAGMAALIRSLRYDGAQTTISRSTVDVNERNPHYYGKLGYGRIDLLKAVKP